MASEEYFDMQPDRNTRAPRFGRAQPLAQARKEIVVV
jgi:hypothetical protein